MAEDEHFGGNDEEIEDLIEKGKEIKLRDAIELRYKPLTAHDLLIKSEEEIKEIKKAREETKPESKREAQKILKNLKILSAIMLGKKSNKELAKVLDTDKSFTSKQIKQLEKEGLINKKGEGRKTRYEVNEFNFMKFLTSKVVVKWSTKTQSKQGLDGPQKTQKSFFRKEEKKNEIK